MQTLAVVRNPIQPLVVGDLITTGPTAEHAWVLVRLVVYEGIISTPAKVLRGVQFANDVIGPRPSVVFVLAKLVVVFAAQDEIGPGQARTRSSPKPGLISFLPSVPIRTSSASVPQQVPPPMSQRSLGHWMMVAAHATPLTTMAALS